MVFMRTFGHSFFVASILTLVSSFFLFETYTNNSSLVASAVQSQDIALASINSAPTLSVEIATTTLIDIQLSTSTEASSSEMLIDPKILPPAKKEKQTSVSIPEQTIIVPQEITLPILSPDLFPALIREIQNLTNQARKKARVPDLVLDTNLTRHSTKRSEEMIQFNYLSHTSKDGCDLTCRFTASDYDSLTWGENLAEFESENPLTVDYIAETFMDKWLNSSGHRKNLLSENFTHQGIGVAADLNRIVVTIVFAAPN